MHNNYYYVRDKYREWTYFMILLINEVSFLNKVLFQDDKHWLISFAHIRFVLHRKTDNKSNLDFKISQDYDVTAIIHHTVKFQ